MQGHPAILYCSYLYWLKVIKFSNGKYEEKHLLVHFKAWLKFHCKNCVCVFLYTELLFVNLQICQWDDCETLIYYGPINKPGVLIPYNYVALRRSKEIHIHWQIYTAVSKVPWNEQYSAVTLSRYNFQNSLRSDNNYSYYYISESLKIFTKCSGTFQKLT